MRGLELFLELHCKKTGGQCFDEAPTSHVTRYELHVYTRFTYKKILRCVKGRKMDSSNAKEIKSMKLCKLNTWHILDQYVTGSL